MLFCESNAPGTLNDNDVYAAQWIPLLGPQCLAVLSVYEQRILQHLFHRMPSAVV
jgi:hypothetical protein